MHGAPRMYTIHRVVRIVHSVMRTPFAPEMQVTHCAWCALHHALHIASCIVHYVYGIYVGRLQSESKIDRKWFYSNGERIGLPKFSAMTTPRWPFGVLAKLRKR